MIERSLVTRLGALQLALAILVAAGFALSSFWLTGRVLQKEETALLRETVTRVARNIDSEVRQEGADAVQIARDETAEQFGTGVRIDVRDADGRIVASTVPERRPAGAARGRRDPPARGRVLSASARTSGGLVVEGTMTGGVRSAALSALARALFLTSLPVFVLALLLSRWTARRVLRPLIDIGGRAETASVEAGVRSLGERSGLAEIDRMASSFDSLLSRLDDALQSERRFTSDASHELRTPLTVLSGEIELALGDPALPAAIRSGLERSAEQARTMQELVEALLLLRRTRAESGEKAGFEPVNLCDVVLETVARAKAERPDRSCDIEVRAPDEVMVSGIPVLLEAALRNLIGNAVKFTNAGEPIRIVVCADPRTATVVVEDGGPGVGSEDRERIFDPFYRGSEARSGRGGFGLGLPILRQVAHAHGGAVAVEAAPLGGARFVLELPAWGADPLRPFSPR